MANGWKITAVIFIILFLAETIFIGSAIYSSSLDYKRELKCANEVCFNQEGTAKYGYTTGVCSCYKENAADPFYQEVLVWLI